VAATVLIVTGLTLRVAWAQGEDPDAVLAEAQRLFLATEYEKAVVALDRVIALLEARTPRDNGTRLKLADAYELRARARFGLPDREGARADFRSLVRTDPGHALTALTGKINPNVVAMFDEVRKALVGTLNIIITPPDAEVQVDGTVLAKAAGRVPILAGAHAVTVAKPAYRLASQNVTVNAGAVADLTVTLERVSATVTVSTVPAGVQVFVDDALKGVTPDGPPLADPGAPPPPPDLSKPLILTDITTGSHVIAFRKPCRVTSQQTLNVPGFSDYSMQPVHLAPATGKISIETGAGGDVFLDGQKRGTAPLTIDEVCEGRHDLDVRSQFGRHLSHLDVRTGDDLKIAATLKPALAILSVVGLEGVRGSDYRLTVEKVLQRSSSVAAIALPAEAVNAALAREGLDAGWLSFDTSRNPIGSAATNITQAARQDLSAKLAAALSVQGVATITVPSKDDPSRAWLTILAAGSGRPDTIEIKTNDPESVGRAIAQIEATVPLFSASSGVQVIDVLDAAGPVVVAVDYAPASGSALVAGDVIVSANGQAVPDIARFNQMVTGERVAFEARDRANAVKKADYQVLKVRQLISRDDQTVMFNPLLLDLRRRLISPNPGEEPIARLNLAVALMGVGNYADARTEIAKVRLPDEKGVAAGTVQYLLGQCCFELGDYAEAETAWHGAVTSNGATLTDGGQPVKDLAEQKLAQMKVKPK
jgi:hypothetical protein